MRKVSHENLHAGDFARSVDDSLDALGVGYIDLLRVHWPERNTPLKETMGALGKAKRDGLTRHISVANFNIAMLDGRAMWNWLEDRLLRTCMCSLPAWCMSGATHPERGRRFRSDGVLLGFVTWKG